MKKYFLYLIFFTIISVCTVILIIPKKTTIAVIGAMDVEINEILSNLSNTKSIQQNDFNITVGDFGKYRIVLSKSGVGKVCAATTTQFIIDKYKPIYIINIGIAGSLSKDLKAGDTIIAEKMVQHDFDVTVFGHPKGYMDNGIEPDKPTIYYSDKNLITQFNKNNKLKTGTIATGDEFVTDLNLKNQIRKEFKADAVDMESAAIAQTAKRNNTPVIILRTISDGANDTIKEYKQNKPTTAQKASEITLSTLFYENK